MTQISPTSFAFPRSGLTALGILGWANALNFGVRGDGIVDDSVALGQLLTLLAGAGGGVAVLPPTPTGYLLGHPVSAPALVTVVISNGCTFPANTPTAGAGVLWDMRAAPGGQVGSGGVPMMQFSELAATPAPPPAGVVSLYAKTDGHLYSLDSTGTETQL